MQHTLKIAGLVLAGGQGRRMQHADKAFMNIAQRPCVDWIITSLKKQCAAIAISANGDAQRFDAWDCPVLADTMQNVGPLAGVLSGLAWAEEAGYDVLVSVPVDTPCIPDTLVNTLLPAPSYASYATQHHSLVAAWPVHTAHALLAAQLTSITEQNRKQNTRVCTLTQALGSRPVDFLPLSAFDPFLNINTPEDLQAVQAIWHTRMRDHHGL